MLRDYELEKQIIAQYITKDRQQQKGEKPCILASTPLKKTKYKRSVFTNDELVQKKYGLTKGQLDTLIQEMAETYNRQWKIVSNAIFKEHNILISDRALNFRYYKLHPRNEKWGYSEDQSYLLLKMFYIEGKRYKEINEYFGYRGEHSIRNALYQHSSKGFSRLQFFLRGQIEQMPKDEVIDKKMSRKAFLLQTLILNYGLKWDYNKHMLALFYCFIIGTEEEISKIPKELAMLLYKRFMELIDEKKQQKKEMYELIKPNLYEELQLVKQERNRLCSNIFRVKKTKQRNKRDDLSMDDSRDYEQYQGMFVGQQQAKHTIQHQDDNVSLEDLRIFSQEQNDNDCQQECSFDVNIDSFINNIQDTHQPIQNDKQMASQDKRQRHFIVE